MKIKILCETETDEVLKDFIIVGIEDAKKKFAEKYNAEIRTTKKEFEVYEVFHSFDKTAKEIEE